MSDNDVNKIQQNVKELQDQNAIDFQQWKKLGKEIEKLSEKIKLSDTNLVTLMKKIKSDYENLKKIIVDENIQVQLNNKIELNKNEILDSKNKIELNKNEINKKVNIETFQNTIDEISSQLDSIDNNFKLFKNNNGCVSFTELGGVKNNGAVDNSDKLLEAMKHCAINNKILVLDGKFNISKPIVYNGGNSLMVIGTCPNHNSLLTTTNTYNQENTNLYFSNGATLELNKLGSVTFFGVGFSSTSKQYGTGILLKSFSNKFINCKFNQFYKAISAEEGGTNWLGENKILYCGFYNCEYCYHGTDGSDSEFIGNLIHGSCEVGFFGGCAGFTISLNHFYGKKSNVFKFFNTIISDNYIQEEIDGIPSIVLNGSFGCQLVNNKFELNEGESRPAKKSLVEIKTWYGGGNIIIDGNNVHGKSLATVGNLSFIDFTSRDNNGIKDMPIILGTNGIRCCESYFKNNYPLYNIKGTLSYPLNSLSPLGGTIEDYKAEVVNGICYFWVKFSSLPNYADIIKIPNNPSYEYTVQCRLTEKSGRGIVQKTIMTNNGKIQLTDYASYSAGEFCGSFPISHSDDRPISV